MKDHNNNLLPDFEPFIVAPHQKKNSQDISHVFGILKAKIYVSLEDIEETIERRGK